MSKIVVGLLAAVGMATLISPVGGLVAQAVGNQSPGQPATVSVGDARTDQSAGLTISGCLGYRASPDSQAQVEACAYQLDGRLIDCRETTDIAADGQYVISDLLPNRPYVVRAHANGYLETYYGGTTGPAARFDRDTLVLDLDQGLTGIDIQLVEPFTVTGLVVPTQPDEGLDAVVLACPMYGLGGDSPYLGSNCDIANVSTESGGYSLELSPYQPYALIAQAEGRTDIWYGGLVADLPLEVRVVPDPTQIEPLSGAPGQTRSGINLVFGERSALAPEFAPDSSSAISKSNAIWVALISLAIVFSGALGFAVSTHQRRLH